MRIESEIEVPFAAPHADSESGLKVRVGAVPAFLSDAVSAWEGWQTAPGRLLLNVDGAARYLVTNRGREVVVDPLGDDARVRAFLLGSVLGACLQWRGYLTLHASAIETGAGAVLFMGPRGVGKSTLLAALIDRGYRMMADDVSGVAMDADGRPEVFGAFPHVRLCADALERLGWNGKPRALEPTWGEPRKWCVPVERFRDAPLAVRGLFLLATGNGDSATIQPASGSAAFAGVVRNTYRRRLVRALGFQRRHFRMVQVVVRHAPIVRVRRPRDGFRLDTLADRIVEYLEGARSAKSG